VPAQMEGLRERGRFYVMWAHPGEFPCRRSFGVVRTDLFEPECARSQDLASRPCDGDATWSSIAEKPYLEVQMSSMGLWSAGGNPSVASRELALFSSGA
jgi:hypothetical protein